MGLPDPADTAKIDLLCRIVSLQAQRFELSLACEGDEEIIEMDATEQATLIFGYLW
jgi:hypothetical protein